MLEHLEDVKRVFRGRAAHISGTIEEDLSDRETGLQELHLAGLADVVACVLSFRSTNTAEWSSMLPRQIGDEESKERYISWLLANLLISPLSVIGGFIPEITEMVSAQGQTLILMTDQSNLSDRFECLMVSLRLKDQAIPVAWKVFQARDPIGFEVQEALLEAVYSMLPENCSIVLAGDRFYGTTMLVGWCQQHKWQYRLRLKSNLTLEHDGGEISTGGAYKQGLAALGNARFHQTVTTSIGIFHEPWHPDPWIIAMDCKSSLYKVLDYGLRWGIGCLFSDFKSRGFSITKTSDCRPASNGSSLSSPSPSIGLFPKTYALLKKGQTEKPTNL